MGKAVKAKVRADYKHVDKQAELRKTIAADVKKIMEGHDNNMGDPVVVLFSKAFKQVKATLEALNED